MNSLRIVYHLLPTTTPKAERDALATIYRFVLSAHQATRRAAETGAEEDPKFACEERRLIWPDD